MINQQVQNYEIISLLGQGGMANVYLAKHLLLGNKVAIKVLNQEFIHNDNIRKRFITEAKNMYRMTHPNMVRVTDLIEEGDVVAFVMEYIDGKTLKEYLESRGKLRDDELVEIFSQMLDSLSYVHEQQLVHRDIKPSNFMLDNNGKVKLLDFGIAKTLDADALEYTQTTTGMQMGTPMYMSPEQISETKSVNAQSDIYSLGVVLWQMTMGKKPYESQTISNFQLQTKIVNEPLTLTNSIWDSCIQKATQKEPILRYKSCNIWQSEIENLISRNNSKSDDTKIDDEGKTNQNTKKEINISTTTRSGKSLLFSSKYFGYYFGAFSVVILITYVLFDVFYSKNDDNALVLINENIQNSNIIEVQRGFERESYLAGTALDITAPSLQKKARAYLKSAENIDKITAERIKLIDNIKIKILMDCGENLKSIGGPKSIILKAYKKTDPLYPTRMNLDNIIVKDNHNIPFSVLIGTDINKPSEKGLGMKLWKSLISYRKELMDIISSSYEDANVTGYVHFKDPSINSYKDLSDLNRKIENVIAASNIGIDDREAVKMIYTTLTKKERPNGDEPNLHWLSMQFGKSSVIASIGILSSLQNEILKARNNAIDLMCTRIGGGNYSFNSIFPIAFGTTLAREGQEIEIDVLCAAYDSNQNPEVTCEGGQIIEIRDGKAIIRATMPNEDLILRGNITTRNKFGVPVTTRWEHRIFFVTERGKKLWN
jgi:serine/threonine protein kinase